MMRRMFCGRRLSAAGTLAVGLVLVSGCNVKQELLTLQQPAIIGPDAAQSPTAADALRKGVYARLRGAASADGTWDDAGLMTDEWKSANTFSQHQELDSRSMQLNNAEVRSVYDNWAAARGAAYTAIASLNTYLPNPPSNVAQMWLVLGYSELTLAENFCNGIPLGITVDGVAQYSKPYTNVEVYNIAIAHFDSGLALTTATDTATVNVKTALQIMKARSLINLAKFTDAAALMSGISTDYIWMHQYVTTSGDNGIWNYNNSVKRFTVGDSFDTGGIILNALPFASAKDPRVPVLGSTLNSSLGVGFDNVTNFVTQQIWPNRSDPIPFASGVDARLIEAEAKLQANDLAGMMTILNALRAAPHRLGAISSPVMAALPTPASQSAATDLYFREKAFWQFSRGFRLPDLRRLVRQYGRTQDKVFPSGQFFKGGTYQTDVNMPVTTDEQANPLFAGCIDRNA